MTQEESKSLQMTGKSHVMFRGIPQDQFEVNLDMMETLGENAVSTAGFSLPRDDDTFRFSRHLQWDRTDANFASFVPRFKIGDQAHLHVWDSDPRTWFSHAQLVASHLFAGVRKHEADLNDSIEYLIRQPPRSGSPSSLNSYRWRRRKDRS